MYCKHWAASYNNLLLLNTYIIKCCSMYSISKTLYVLDIVLVSKHLLLQHVLHISMDIESKHDWINI